MIKGLSARICALLLIITLLGCREEALVVVTPVVDVPTREIVMTATGRATRRATSTATIVGIDATDGAATDAVVVAQETRVTVSPTSPAPVAPTVEPTLAPTAAPTVAATATASATASATAVATPGSTPVIHYFELIAEEEMNPGKRLTFSWSAEGDEVRLLAQTQMRFMPWWVTPISGTMTIELQRTLFPDPEVVLQAFGAPDENGLRGDPVSASIAIPWPCEHDYYFTPAPERCPREAATRPAAAIQPFEGGRMVWLQAEGSIVVLYNVGLSGAEGTQMRVFDDLWREGDVEIDPEIVPPEGLLQPARGFGKVWRENVDVRETLGWATAPEAAFTATWQFESNESIGSTSYLQLNDGRIIRLYGYYLKYGSWQYLEQ